VTKLGEEIIVHTTNPYE